MTVITRSEIMRVDNSQPEEFRHDGEPIPPNAVVREQLRRVTDLTFQMDRPQPQYVLSMLLAENCVDAVEKEYRSFFRYGEKTQKHTDQLKASFRNECYRHGIGVSFSGRADQMVLFNHKGIIGYWASAFMETPTNYRFVLVLDYAHQDLFKSWVAQNIRETRPCAVRRIYIEQGGDALRTRTEIVQDQDITPSSVQANYPYFDFTPSDLWFEFAASPAHVMPLLGPAGTGKSTYARAMLDARGWDNRIFLIDSIPVIMHPGLMDFIRGLPLGSVVICEDADLLLGKREEGNHAMSAFLNTTSGLATRDIKFIVLTNLPTIDKMDDAIVRSGRNHRTMEFKHLTPNQAQMVRRNMGLSDLPDVSKRERWTLADVIHYKTDMPSKSLFGFNRS